MQYNILDYPNGYEKVRDEELIFLPSDKNIRENFMLSVFEFLIWL